MIKQVTMYTVICDNCLLDIAESQEYSCWNDKGFAEMQATESDWLQSGKKHYCPDCYFYYDNDKLKLDELRTKVKQ